MSKEDYDEIAKKTSLWPVTIAFGVVTIIWALNFRYGLPLNLEERGTFGDMFGAANSLFSGVAFVGVIYAVSLQRQEVSIAKFEISKTKEILDNQQTQLKLQNLEMQKQSFEGTFFQMLRLFTDLVSGIDIVAPDGKVTDGKDALRVFESRLERRMEQNPGDFNTAYTQFCVRHSSELGHYFRMLYNIFKFVDSSSIENKIFYTNIVRAQLSDPEVSLLFHNCLSDNGLAKFKPLVEKYTLLKNFDNIKHGYDRSLIESYAGSAFSY